MLELQQLRSVVISVSDLERSLAFYRDLLGFEVSAQIRAPGGSTITILDVGGGHTLQLVSLSTETKPSGWLPDDLQTGFRHVGFKARDVDTTAARLKRANVPFTLDPLDATGGVRIAFFKDPDGALLEIVQGELHYHVDGPAVRSLPRVSPSGETLHFDHVAVTVSDLAAALAFYRDELGCPIIGQLFLKDARDFTITYLKAGTGVIELFSFSKPNLPNYWAADMAVVGLKHVVLQVASTASDSTGTPLFQALDGTPFELVSEPFQQAGSIEAQGRLV
jgi:catechol 2,3-dioxygenase-like lactoylglutathione lyase family enzyme